MSNNIAVSEKKKEFIRTVKFTLFSLSAGIIQIGSETVLLEVVHAWPWLAYLIGLILSVLWNFTVNRKFTFKSANNIPFAMMQVALFYLVFAPLSTLWTWLLTDKAGWNEYLVLVITMVINFVSEYLYQRYVVFKDSLDTAVKEEKR